MDRVGLLVESLYPSRRIKWDGSSWRIGSHGALSVMPDGVWFDHETGACGDVVELVRYALHCSYKEAFADLKKRGWHFDKKASYKQHFVYLTSEQIEDLKLEVYLLRVMERTWREERSEFHRKLDLDGYRWSRRQYAMIVGRPWPWGLPE